MSNIKIFEDRKIRTLWDSEKEDWWFSVHDVVEILSDCKNVRDYIKKMRNRDEVLKSNWGTICHPLENVGKDGRKREILMADTKGILRLIQSIPSPKAEPFKVWLAQVGAERLDEIADPEKAIMRGAEFYRAKGYSDGWINQRLQTIEMRKKLTDEWKERGIEKEKDYAILTNEMTKAWSGMTVQEYKQLKDLKKENLRDNMTDIELVLNMLAEVSTTALSKQEQPETFDESKQIAKEGGKVAKNARNDLENRLGHSVISSLNASNKELLETKEMKKLPKNKK